MEDFVFAGPFGPLECIIEKYRGEGACPATLVMCHGFRGSRESGGRAVLVAREAARCCEVVRWNFTGTQILSKWRQELEAVLAEIKRRVPGRRLFVLGRSLGGACAFVTTAADKDVDGLILWAAPHDLRGTFRHVMGEADYARLDAGEIVHYDDERGVCDVDPAFLTDFDKYDFPLLWQTRPHKPVLVLHCKGDEVVTVGQALRNAELARQSGADCELHLFAGGDHSFTAYSEAAGEIIARWLAERL